MGIESQSDLVKVRANTGTTRETSTFEKKDESSKLNLRSFNSKTSLLCFRNFVIVQPTQTLARLVAATCQTCHLSSFAE